MEGAIGNLERRSNRKSGDSIYTSALRQSKVVYEGQVFSLKSLSLFSMAITKWLWLCASLKTVAWFGCGMGFPCLNMCSLVNDAVWEGCRRRQNLSWREWVTGDRF